MLFLKSILDSGLLVILGIVLSFACTVGLFYMVGKAIGSYIRKQVFKLPYSYIKDPVVREKVLAEIAKAQKELASQTGQERKKKVVQVLQSFFKSNLDDGLIADIVQGIYDELIKENK